MKRIAGAVQLLLLWLGMNLAGLYALFQINLRALKPVFLLAALGICIWPVARKGRQKRSWQMLCGSRLLELFSVMAAVNTLELFAVIVVSYNRLRFGFSQEELFFAGWQLGMMASMMAVLSLLLLFGGMVRMWLYSTRLDWKQRLLPFLLAWLPVWNVWYTKQIVRTACEEAEDWETGVLV